MSQQLCAHRHLENSSMCSAGEEEHPAPAARQGHPDHRPPRITPRDRRARGRPLPPFRNL